MKKISLLILVLFSVSSLSWSQSIPKPSGFVNDFADLIDRSYESKILETVNNFEKETSVEIAVVTVDDMQGYKVEDFTKTLFNKWGIGKKDINNGILLFMAKKERKIYIKTGSGIVDTITNQNVDSVIKTYMTPEFKKNSYGKGFLNAVNNVISIYKTKTENVASNQQNTSSTVNSTSSTKQSDSYDSTKYSKVEPKDDGKSIITFFQFVFVIIVLAVLILFFVVFPIRKKKEFESKKSSVIGKLEVLKESLESIKENKPHFMSNLEFVMSNVNEKHWKDYIQKISSFSETNLELQISSIIDTASKSKKIEELQTSDFKDQVSSINGQISEYESARKKINEIYSIASETINLIGNLSRVISSAKNNFDAKDEDISMETKNDFDKYISELSSYIDKKIDVYSDGKILKYSYENLQRTIKKADKEKRDAEEARVEGPRKAKEMKEKLEKLESQIRSGDSTSRRKYEEAAERYNTIVVNGGSNFTAADYFLLNSIDHMIHDTESSHHHFVERESYRSHESENSPFGGGRSSDEDDIRRSQSSFNPFGGGNSNSGGGGGDDIGGGGGVDGDF